MKKNVFVQMKVIFLGHGMGIFKFLIFIPFYPFI